MRREEKEESGGVKDRPPCRYVDPEKLLKIWYSNSMKGDGIGLISKLFTVCQGDIQVLLSKGTEDSRDTGMPVNNRTLKKSSDMRQSYSSGNDIFSNGESKLKVPILTAVLALMFLLTAIAFDA